jgi:HSP20 family molecular chaperone IbpA
MFTTRGTSFDKMCDDIFGAFEQPIWKTTMFAAEDKGYVVENGILYISLPGFSKEDVDVSIDGRTLIVSAEISKEDENPFRKSFKRSWLLADDTSDEVAASMEDGLLSLSFGKAPEKKKVKIS